MSKVLEDKELIKVGIFLTHTHTKVVGLNNSYSAGNKLGYFNI